MWGRVDQECGTDDSGPSEAGTRRQGQQDAGKTLLEADTSISLRQSASSRQLIILCEFLLHSPGGSSVVISSRRIHQTCATSTLYTSFHIILICTKWPFGVCNFVRARPELSSFHERTKYTLGGRNHGLPYAFLKCNWWCNAILRRGLEINIKAKLWEISSDTHQLQLIKLHHFKLERYKWI